MGCIHVSIIENISKALLFPEISDCHIKDHNMRMIELTPKIQLLWGHDVLDINMFQIITQTCIQVLFLMFVHDFTMQAVCSVEIHERH